MKTIPNKHLLTEYIHIFLAFGLHLIRTKKLVIMNNYSGTKCLLNGCESTSFEFVNDRPLNCDSGRVAILRCSICKRIVNFAPLEDPVIKIDKLIEMIKEIHEK